MKRTLKQNQKQLRAIQNYELFAFWEFLSRLLRLIIIVYNRQQQPTMNIMDASDELRIPIDFMENSDEWENFIHDSVKRAKDGSRT